jgi:hypothetical protein
MQRPVKCTGVSASRLRRIDRGLRNHPGDGIMAQRPTREKGVAKPKKRSKVSTKFQKVQDAETAKKTRRRAYISTHKGREIMPLAQYVWDNENSGKSVLQLYEEFREGCGHQFQEVACLYVDGQRTAIHTCRRCFIMVRGVGKPTAKNRIGNGES